MSIAKTKEFMIAADDDYKNYAKNKGQKEKTHQVAENTFLVFIRLIIHRF